MDLSVFFEKIVENVFFHPRSRMEGYLGSQIKAFTHSFPNWQEGDIVLIGGRQESADKNSGADLIRKELYRLSSPSPSLSIIDLGNLKGRERYEDYLEALRYVIHHLLEEKKKVLILGGSHTQSWSQVMAFDDSPYPISAVSIDKRFDLDLGGDTPDSHSHNRHLLEEKKDWLYNFTQLGYQRFEVSEADKDFLSERHFPCLRLGELQPSPREAEAELRLADVLSIDLSALRFADAPGSSDPSPAGFDASQLCTLARYAGMGYRLSCFSITEFNPETDIRGQTASLSAMALWYLIDGFANRWEDPPAPDRSNLRKYSVKLHASVEEINFFQHPHSLRWWMEVPHPDSLGSKMGQMRLVPCTEKDYDFAKTDNIPERWWQTYYKMMK